MEKEINEWRETFRLRMDPLMAVTVSGLEELKIVIEAALLEGCICIYENTEKGSWTQGAWIFDFRFKNSFVK